MSGRDGLSTPPAPGAVATAPGVAATVLGDAARAPRTLSVCADDFGQSPGISAGIVTLARAGRLTATSCLTNGRHWPTSAALLKEVPAALDVGLHLNLTEGRPLSRRLGKRWPSLPGLGRLIALAHLGRLPRAELRSEFHAQLASFIHHVGRAPKFIDGHQHIHHLPGVRELILDMAEHVQPLPAFRSTARVLGPGSAVKRWLIERTGGRALKVQLDRRMIAHNPVLLGAYGFDRADYGSLVRGWLARVPREGALLFCHPGGTPPAGADVAVRRDPIAAARAVEFAYLGSADFLDDLAAADVVLGAVWQLGGMTADRPWV